MPFKDKLKLFLPTTTTKYLLDEVADVASVAYSLRRLSQSYSGSAIRVRRSSDNSTLDIGFSGDDLDLTALLAFCGSGDGFVETWYDLSGNNYHATQITNGSQPLIVEAGICKLVNGRPSLYCPANAGLQVPDNAFGVLTAGAEHAVFRQYPNGNGGYAKVSSSGLRNHSSWVDNVAYLSFLSLQRAAFAGYGVTLNLSIHSSLNSGTSLTIYKDNIYFGTSPITFANSPTNSQVPDTVYGAIDISEYIIFGLAPTFDRAVVESNMASYYNIVLN